MADLPVGQHGELVPHRGFSRWRSPVDLGPVSAWRSHDGILVTSGLHDAFLPGTDGEVGPTWLVSISRIGEQGRDRRPSDQDLTRVVDAFAMPAFDEDNHHPGIARHLFCPHDEVARQACECKLTETVIEEPDGYRWSNDDTEPCRGCLYALQFGLPCTIHGTVLR